MESRAAGAPSAQCYAGTGGRGQPEPGPLPGRSLASRTGLFGECSRPATWKVARQPGAGQGSADARRQVWGDFGFNAGDLQAIDRDNAARLLPRAGRSA
jgi:hypothetical protein